MYCCKLINIKISIKCIRSIQQWVSVKGVLTMSRSVEVERSHKDLALNEDNSPPSLRWLVASCMSRPTNKHHCYTKI